MIDLFIYLSALIGFLLFYLLLGYLKKVKEARRWKDIKRKTFPKNYEIALLNSFHPYKFLRDEEKQRLKWKILYFLEYKQFSTIGPFELTESMKLIIAAQACLLIINLDVGVYPSLINIYVAADTFIEKDNFIDSQTMLPAHVPRLGESWTNGPIILSWNSIRAGVENWKDGQNVVLHEFTHQLDNLEGGMNGLPPVEGHTSKKWQILMTKEFSNLRRKILDQRENDFGEYASTDPSEFLAVTVEHFFERPIEFQTRHPEFFELYKNYFKLNPIEWYR